MNSRPHHYARHKLARVTPAEGYTNLPNALFAILHTCGLLKTATYCYIAHYTARYITVLSETVSLYFLKYSPYKKIFKLKCVDLNVICILCHILIFYTTNRSVPSHTVQCVPHVNTKPYLIETNKKHRRTSRTCFASVMGISKRRELITDTAFALHPM